MAKEQGTVDNHTQNKEFSNYFNKNIFDSLLEIEKKRKAVKKKAKLLKLILIPIFVYCLIRSVPYIYDRTDTEFEFYLAFSSAVVACILLYISINSKHFCSKKGIMELRNQYKQTVFKSLFDYFSFPTSFKPIITTSKNKLAKTHLFNYKATKAKETDVVIGQCNDVNFTFSNLLINSEYKIAFSGYFLSYDLPFVLNNAYKTDSSMKLKPTGQNNSDESDNEVLQAVEVFLQNIASIYSSKVEASVINQKLYIKIATPKQLYGFEVNNSYEKNSEKMYEEIYFMFSLLSNSELMLKQIAEKSLVV